MFTNVYFINQWVIIIIIISSSSSMYVCMYACMYVSFNSLLVLV